MRNEGAYKLGMIEAEIQDATKQLADCIREQAANLLRRADGIERGGIVINEETGIAAVQARENALAKNLIDDMKVLSLKEAEYSIRYKRLLMEHSIQTEQNETEKG